MTSFAERRMVGTERHGYRTPVGKLEDGVKVVVQKMKSLGRNNDLTRAGENNPAYNSTSDTNLPTQPSQDELVIGQGDFLERIKESQSKNGSLEPEVPPFNPEGEVTHKPRIREIEPRDINTMVDQGWFKDLRRVVHLWGDTINDETLPNSWTNKTQVDRFKKILNDFYFPKGVYFDQPVYGKDPEGKRFKIKDVRVRRKTLVLEQVVKKQGEKDRIELAGTTSWLEGEQIKDENGNVVGMTTGDPWSKPEEPPASHTQMHFIKTEWSGQGLGLLLAIARTEAIFNNTTYKKIVTWVNKVGDYLPNEKLFESMGYDEKENKDYDNTTDPKMRMKMRRFELDRDTWFKGAQMYGPDGKLLEVGRAACIQRWDTIQIYGPHRQQNLG